MHSDIQIERTNSSDPDFQKLIVSLDIFLKKNDGEEHAFYARMNTTEAIRHVVVAYVEKTAIGCGSIKPYSRDTTEIKRMFVEPTYRNRGIAGLILKELESWTLELGFKNCILETGKNMGAHFFYEKAGYHVIPNYGEYVNAKNSICMTKKLTKNVVGK